MERILDTSSIDMTNNQIVRELEINLERMNKLNHTEAPKRANAYKVIVKPSNITYSEMLYRFRFEIQYGRLKWNKKFKPLGNAVFTQSEVLPFR